MDQKKNKISLSPATLAYYQDRVNTIMNDFQLRLAQIRRERREVVERIQQSIDRDRIQAIHNKQ